MPTELEELVEFLHHGNTQIRQVATQQLVGYSAQSTHQTTLFKRSQLEPIKDLKLLIRDYTQIATDALTILINLTGSGDREILESLSRDQPFTESLLAKIIDDITEPNADLCCALLANLVKDDTLAERLISPADPDPTSESKSNSNSTSRSNFSTRPLPPKTHTRVKLQTTSRGEVSAQKIDDPVPLQISTSRLILDQLMDVFVKGTSHTLNPAANYDYLSYVFADLSKHKRGRSYLLTIQPYDSVVPLTKLVVFTEHGSLIRRKGIASTIKNCAFEVPHHAYLLRSETEVPPGVGLLPYILLPLAGNEEFDAEDSEGMLDELQLLAPDKEREADDDIVATHLETLLLLTSEREGREVLRRVKVYPVIRELHLKREAEGVQEGCERLVDILVRDEEGVGRGAEKTEEEEDDEDEKIEEVF